MSSDSFLEMMGVKETAFPQKQVHVRNDLVDAYNFMYDKPNHNNAILQTYQYILQHPPEGAAPTEVAKSVLLSLNEAELEEVLTDLNKQFPTSSAEDVDVVSEFKKLDEMGQYKFFTKIRKLFDDEDWQTLLGEL